MQDNGHIRLHRKFRNWEWYTDINVKTLFIELLFQANWKDDNYKGVVIKRGSLTTGRKKLADATGLSQQEIRTALDKLKSTNEITSQATNRYTVITVVNYNKYQYEKNGSNQLSNQPSTKPATTTKELKELKEVSTNNIVIRIPYNQILKTWNETKELASIRLLTDKRKKKIKKVYEIDDGETFKEIVVRSINSNFMVEQKLTNIDWMMNENNYAKILEGKYDNKE
jgi:hypothetical protein